MAFQSTGHINDASSPDTDGVDLNVVSACLDEERRALETLLFKLCEESLVLLAGQHRWLTRTTDEIRQAAANLAFVGDRRTRLVRQVAAELGLDASTPLDDLAAVVTEPGISACWRAHGVSMRGLLEQVRHSTEGNRALLARGLSAAEDALALLGVTPTYGAGGTAPLQASRRAQMLDARA